MRTDLHLISEQTNPLELLDHYSGAEFLIFGDVRKGWFFAVGGFWWMRPLSFSWFRGSRCAERRRG